MVSVTKGSLLKGLVIVMEYSKLYSIPKNQTATFGVQFIALSTESRLKPYLLNPLPATNRHIMNLFSCHHFTSTHCKLSTFGLTSFHVRFSSAIFIAVMAALHCSMLCIGTTCILDVLLVITNIRKKYDTIPTSINSTKKKCANHRCNQHEHRNT